jgi:hypothetical protein
MMLLASQSINHRSLRTLDSFLCVGTWSVMGFVNYAKMRSQRNLRTAGRKWYLARRIVIDNW